MYFPYLFNWDGKCTDKITRRFLAGSGPSQVHRTGGLVLSLKSMSLKASLSNHETFHRCSYCSDPNLSWPPPDPDRIPRKTRPILSSSDPFTIPHFDSPVDEMAAFRRRQQEDLARRAGEINDDSAAGIRRRRKFHERYKSNKSSQIEAGSENETAEDSEGNELEEGEQTNGPEVNDYIDVDEGEEAWRNAEGERLDDFGVDEDVEFYDEEDVPLSVLKERLKAGL